MIQHPVDFQQLPEAARKVLGAAAPLKALAARGKAPVPPTVLLCALYGLAYDADPALAEAARGTLGNLPEPILQGALSAPELPPAVLDALATHNLGNRPLLERLLQHPSLADDTLVALARYGNEALCERIAVNESRLLRCPAIIQSLYFNPACRMSTTDRLVELAARNGVHVDIPQFEGIAAALQDQLVPEPSDEPLPSDEDFTTALAETEGGTVDDVTEDEEGTVVLNERAKKADKRIEEMTVTEKIRTAMLGNGTQRAVLIRATNRLVSSAVLESPKLTEDEVIKFSASRQVGEDVLRRIAGRRDWFRIYEVKRNLVFNPKTPVAESLKILNHLMAHDVKKVKESKNVSASLRTAATALLSKRK
jgi:hypothetical protein